MTTLFIKSLLTSLWQRGDRGDFLVDMALLMNSLVIIKAFGIYHVCLSFYATDALNHAMI
jgi:hypothetical protein